MPKSFDFGGKGEGAAETPPPIRQPRHFDFVSEPITHKNGEVRLGSTGTQEVFHDGVWRPVVADRAPRTFGFAPPTAASPAATPHPRTLEPAGSGAAPNQRKERPRTLTDTLVERAKSIDPDISQDIRGKIDSLLKFATIETLMNFGDKNLAPMLVAGNVEAKIARELIRIDVVSALNETKNVVQRPLTLMEKLSGKTPSFYEHRLSLARQELARLVNDAENMIRSAKPELSDMRHDMIAIVVTHPEFPDDRMKQIGSSRAKTLTQAHATAVMTFNLLEQYSQQCAEFVSQIDQMVSVTIPAWTRAMGKP